MLAKRVIPIHVWGGYGSQLFALALYFKLIAIHPNKSFKFIFHTSGVTKRTLQIESHLRNVPFSIVDDFILNIPNSSFEKSTFTFTFLKSKLRPFLEFLGFISNANNESSLLKLKPWLIAIRGHYSQIRITSEILDQIFQTQKSDFEDGIALHLRLGDLLTIHQKNPIKPELITAVINEVRFSKCVNTLHIYSDSTNAITTYLPLLKNYQIIKNELDIESQIIRMARYEYFVGTNSKISLWVALIRCLNLNDNLSSFLPKELKIAIESNLRSDLVQKVHFYG